MKNESSVSTIKNHDDSIFFKIERERKYVPHNTSLKHAPWKMHHDGSS
jgi:hypothetical protein